MKIRDQKTEYGERIYEHASFAVFLVSVFRTL